MGNHCCVTNRHFVTNVPVRLVFFSQVILDSKKRIFTWGFGGYGRLGHADNKDEMVPRLVKFFDGPNKMATMIAAGSTFSFGLNEHGNFISVKSLSICSGYPAPEKIHRNEKNQSMQKTMLP